MIKYKILNRESYPRQRPPQNAPTVNFSFSTGTVYFSKTACELMKLKKGDKVEVLQEEDNALHFGFRKTDSENGFLLRPKKVGQCFTSKPFVIHLLTIMGDYATTTVQLATKPRDGAYWPIIKTVRKVNK